MHARKDLLHFSGMLQHGANMTKSKNSLSEQAISSPCNERRSLSHSPCTEHPRQMTTVTVSQRQDRAPALQLHSMLAVYRADMPDGQPTGETQSGQTTDAEPQSTRTDRFSPQSLLDPVRSKTVHSQHYTTRAENADTSRLSLTD